MAEHAFLSPSSGARTLACVGSLAMSAGIPNTTSKYALEGTVAHLLASAAWEDDKPPSAYVGRVFQPDPAEESVEITDDMADYVQGYLDKIGEYAYGIGEDEGLVSDALVEQRVDTSHVVGVNGQFGTADFIILDYGTDELQVHDLKYGKGVVVDADDNIQLMQYAAGALRQYSPMHPFKTVRMAIHQVRLNHLSEWCITVEELKDRIAKMRPTFIKAYRLAKETKNLDAKFVKKYLSPSDKAGQDHCRFCPALPTCPAVEDLAHKTAMDWFDDLDAPDSIRELPDGAKLAESKGLTPLLDMWCKAINAKAHAELLAGHALPGYKLVLGKKGNRAWDADNETTIVQLIEGHYGDEAYTKKLLTPAAAQTAAKKKHITDIWDALKVFVIQPDGKPQVVLESDSRPGLSVAPLENSFEELT